MKKNNEEVKQKKDCRYYCCCLLKGGTKETDCQRGSVEWRSGHESRVGRWGPVDREIMDLAHLSSGERTQYLPLPPGATAQLTMDRAISAQETMNMYLEIGRSGELLDDIRKDKESTSVANRWQRML